MLSLQLKSGDYLTIGDDIAVQIFQQSGSAFSVAVKAPREIPILRGEVLEREGEGRPDGLRSHRPQRPSKRVRNAKNAEAFAQRKERMSAAALEMRGILDRMEMEADRESLRGEIKALRERLELIAPERPHEQGG